MGCIPSLSWTRGLVKFWPCIFWRLLFFFNIALLGTVSSSFIMELLVRVADLDAELCVTERRYEMHLRSCEKIRDYNIEKSRPRHLLGCIVPWPRHNLRVATCLVDMPSIV